MVTPTPDDALEFAGIASRILESSIESSRPTEVYVVHIDNWFDMKWLAFSGKVVGAVGVWAKPLTVPPFHPNRVLSQSHFSLDAVIADYVVSDVAPLHRKQTSAENLNRHVRKLSDSAIFFWYSGASAKTRRGSMMLYTIADTQVSSWYASYHCAPEWRLLHARGISTEELAHLEKTHLTR